MLFRSGVNPNVHFGTVNTPADLSSVSTGQFTGFNYGVTVVVKSTNTVWQMHESFDGTDSEVKWRDTHLSFDEFQMKLDYRNYNLELKNGDKIWIGFTSTPANWNYNGDLHIKILKQDIKVSWGATASARLRATLRSRTMPFCRARLSASV